MEKSSGEKHGKNREKDRNQKSRILHFSVIALCVTAVVMAVFFFLYVSDYYRADASAEAALVSDEVRIEETDYGWFFDGPSDDAAMIFYPGAKVEETAYAPLLHRLAAAGMDVCLAQMPFHLAVFDKDAADEILKQYSYENWYIGGHSLGGAMAAEYAAGHSDAFSGLILLAAYSAGEIPSSLPEIVLVGSEDRIINREKLALGRQYAPENYAEYVIEGGNHAQFGSYGEQKGDGSAAITPQQQAAETVERITDFTGEVE